MKILIVLGGEKPEPDFLQKQAEESDFIIAADSGGDFLAEENIVPDILLGDFDSISPENYRIIRESGAEIISWPAEKDYTDSELAFRKALEKNPSSVTVTGGLGSRFDHSLANVGLAAKFAGKNIRTCIASADTRIYPVTSAISMECRKNDYVSLIPFMGKVFVKETDGLFFPLADEYLSPFESRGISNFSETGFFSIKISEGLLLVVISGE